MPHGYGYSSGPGFTNDPRYEYSFADRLAEFLLGMSALSGQTAGVLRQQDLDAEAQQAKQFNLFQSLAKLQQEQQTQQGTVAALRRLNPGVVGTMPDNEVAGLTKLPPEILKTFLFPQAGKTPEGFTLGEGQARFDAQGNVVAERPRSPKEQAEAGFTLGPGQQRFDAQGNPIASVPGVDKHAASAKPWWEGKTSIELRGIANDPDMPADVRAKAQATLKDIDAADLQRARETGAVGVQHQVQAAREKQQLEAYGPQKETAEERQLGAKRMQAIEISRNLAETVKTNPGWVGGAFGLVGRARAGQSSAGMAPEGYADFEADLDYVLGLYSRDVMGAAMGPNEKSTFLAFLPNRLKDSSQQFEAKLRRLPQRWAELQALMEERRSGTAMPGATPGPGSAGDASPKRGHSAPGWSVAP